MTDSSTPQGTAPDGTPDTTQAAPKRRGLTLGIAFVAVAALAATAGALGVRSLGAEQPSAEGGEGGHNIVPVAEISYGEARGYDEVHQEESLVDAEWLAANLDDPSLVIVEVSEGRSAGNDPLGAYEQGHVPGAHGAVWYRDFVQRVDRDLATREEITALAQSWGLDDDSTLILYGDANNWFAAYAAWVFKLYGFEDVRLLDGGRDNWVNEGHPLDQTTPPSGAGSWEAKEPNSDIRAFQSEVLQVVNGEIPGVLVDIRGVPEFQGEIGVAEGFGGEAAAKWGHIPGAVNAPWGQIVNQPDDGGDGTYLDVEAIRAHYAELGIDGSVPIYAYCRIGERASHTWYALSQLLGYEVKLYDGSWTEWGNSVGVPVENPTLEASGGFSGLWGGN